MGTRLMQIYGDFLKAMKQEAEDDKKAAVDSVADGGGIRSPKRVLPRQKLELMLKGTAGADKLQTLFLFSAK